MNLGKLATWGRTTDPCPTDLQYVANDVWECDKPEHERGIKVLRAPFGTDAYISAHNDTLHTKRAQLLHMLPKLPSLQIARLLLYFCAVPRVNHPLRAPPPSATTKITQHHDRNILSTFIAVSGAPNRANWSNDFHGIRHGDRVQQSTRPLHMGCMGLRNSARTAPAAYWAS